MEASSGSNVSSPAAVYDRVVREARIKFGAILGEEAAERAARDAVDEFLVRKAARVTTFVPVLAMRRLRESIPAASTSGD